MNSWERIKRMYEHREADRVPIVDIPWPGTLRRWHREGLPMDMPWETFFGTDKVSAISIDISPRFEQVILEETDRYIISTTQWGATVRNFKEEDSTPEMMDYRVTDQIAWAEAKARMTLEDDRIPWKLLKENYDRWRAEGHWIRANFWFGFDVTQSRLMGLEPCMFAMMETPEFVMDIFDTYLRSCEILFSRIWDTGYHFDEMFWWDDMGYKGRSFFSPNMYREMVQPFHRRAVQWAHDRGIYAQLHSCGNIMNLLPDIVDIGVDALNPLEVKAGMDAFKIKAEYGDRLTLSGGINAATMHDPEIVLEEIRQRVPVLKENGGYMFASDHTIPNDVSLQTMQMIVAEAKRAGSYD